MVQVKIVKNTIIILITSLFIKLLGLLNKIILTRSLGENGISLYSLILPTIMLFLSISCFSLNISMIKVAANNKSKKIIKTGISIALITSSIASLILLLIINVLSNKLLKQPSSYYPILFSIPLLYLTSISSVLRGYLTGIEKITTTSIANLIEQIIRIIFTILIFIIIKSNNLIIFVVFSIIAMSIGELFSILFSIFNIKKIKNNININDDTVSKELLSISIPQTLNSLSSNIIFFFEPIIYTFILSKLNYNSNEILLKYSEVTSYSIPLITLFSFVSMSLSTAIMPKISTSSSNEINKLITKLIVICLIPGILVSTILYHYSYDLTMFLYKTSIGSDIVKKYVWFFLCFYLISPLNVILISTNQSKTSFKISLFVHIIKLIIILIFPIFTKDGLIISYLISYLLTFIIEIIILYRKYHFKIPFYKIIILIIIAVIINCLSIILNIINIHYIIQILIISLIYLLLIINIFKRNNI